jgi:hypothetical protein
VFQLNIGRNWQSTVRWRYTQQKISGGSGGNTAQAATAELISMFLQSPIIKVIYFNDPMIPRVKPQARHDDHFHVTIKG